MASLTDLLTSKIPPHNLEAERAVLGAVLLEPEAQPCASAMVTPTDFYKEGHRQIFAAMDRLGSAGTTVDIITVMDALRRQAALEEVGGPGYLAGLVEEATTLAQLPTYCQIIADKARTRDVIRLSTELISKAYENGQPSTDLITSGAKMFEVLVHRATTAIETFPARLLRELIHLDIPDPTFLVENWVPSGAMSFIVGDSEAYKSWFADLMGMSVAAGVPFLDKFPTVQAPTLIISEENGIAEDKRRVKLLSRGHAIDVEGVPCHMASDASFSFDDPVRYLALRRYIDQHAIRMVILDSFVRVHRRKENDAGDMNALYQDKMKPIMKDGVALVFLHHRRKAQIVPGAAQPTGDSDEIRGSGDIRAATLAVLFLRTLSVTQVLVKHN
jgi:hypothetical protein